MEEGGFEGSGPPTHSRSLSFQPPASGPEVSHSWHLSPRMKTKAAVFSSIPDSLSSVAFPVLIKHRVSLPAPQSHFKLQSLSRGDAAKSAQSR